MSNVYLFEESSRFLSSSELAYLKLDHYLSMKDVFKEEYLSHIKSNKMIESHIHYSDYDPHNQRFNLDNIILAHYYYKDGIIEDSTLILELQRTKTAIIEEFLEKNKPVFSHNFLLEFIRRYKALDSNELLAKHFDLNIQFKEPKEKIDARFDINKVTPFLLKVFEHSNINEDFIRFFEYITHDNHPDREQKIALYTQLYKNCKNIKIGKNLKHCVAYAPECDLDIIYHNLTSPEIRLKFILFLQIDKPELFEKYFDQLSKDFSPSTENLTHYFSNTQGRYTSYKHSDKDTQLDRLMLKTSIDYNSLLKFKNSSSLISDNRQLIEKIDFFILENFNVPNYMKAFFLNNNSSRREEVQSLIEKKKLLENLTPEENLQKTKIQKL